MTDLTTSISHIWQVFVSSNTFNFVIFASIIVLIMKKINIAGIINSLHENIVKAIENAKAAKEEAKKQLSEVEKSVENLPQELKSIIEDAARSAEVISEKLLKDAQKQVEHIESNAVKVIDAEGKMLVSKLTNKVSKASIEVAKSHITATLEQDKSLHDKYIDESIDSLDKLKF